MDDVHQKTIVLKHTTVKVPGKRPPKAITPAQGTCTRLIYCNSLVVVKGLKKVL